jgi:hypothetical protein
MQELLERLENKIDILDDKLDSIDKTLFAQSITLDEHQKRSTSSEKRIELLEKWKIMFDAILKVGGALAALAGSVYTVVKIIELLSK